MRRNGASWEGPRPCDHGMYVCHHGMRVRCVCMCVDVQRMMSAVQSLGEDEIRDIIQEQGQVEVTCEWALTHTHTYAHTRARTYAQSRQARTVGAVL